MYNKHKTNKNNFNMLNIINYLKLQQFLNNIKEK